jgi:hypothetical protein
VEAMNKTKDVDVEEKNDDASTSASGAASGAASFDSVSFDGIYFSQALVNA